MAASTSDPQNLFWLKNNVEKLSSAEFELLKCKQKYARTKSGLEVDLELRKKDNGNFSKLQYVCSRQYKAPAS